jgi:hypothetical protein
MAAADQETRSDDQEQGAWGRPVSLRIGEIVMAAVLLAVSVFFVTQAYLLDFGTIGRPGSGFFPLALGIALGLVSLVILHGAVRAPSRGEVVYLGHRNVLVVLVALVGVALTFEQADTYVVLGTFVAVLLLAVARTTPWRALLGASLGMVLVWAVFNLALGVRLPAGDFWAQLVAPIAASLPSSPF